MSMRHYASLLHPFHEYVSFDLKRYFSIGREVADTFLLHRNFYLVQTSFSFDSIWDLRTMFERSDMKDSSARFQSVVVSEARRGPTSNSITLLIVFAMKIIKDHRARFTKSQIFLKLIGLHSATAILVRLNCCHAKQLTQLRGLNPSRMPLIGSNQTVSIPTSLSKPRTWTKPMNRVRVLSYLFTNQTKVLSYFLFVFPPNTDPHVSCFMSYGNRYVLLRHFSRTVVNRQHCGRFHFFVRSREL
jgi:hypothetical protein